MANPITSGANAQVVDRRLSKIFVDRFKQLPTKIDKLYTMKKGRRGPDERMANYGAFNNFSEFNGTVNYQSSYQGYNVIATYKHFASGFQVDRTFAEDDLFNLVDGYPAKLATAAQRTRETHAARMFVLGFSVDTDFYVNSEGVALCSGSHTTATPGVSTASGFSNIATAGMSYTSVVANRIQMRGYRDDNGNRIDVMPDELWYPPDLCATAYEILESMGRPDNANNAASYTYDKFTGYEWNYMSDVNDWFMVDSSLKKDMVMWFDRIPVEFARAEDLDTIVMKWRARMRYSFSWSDWRWVLGNQVS